MTTLFLLSICSLSHAFAQTQLPIKELKIGEQCPDFEFDNMINYPKATVHLSDFKGKLIILDFWATWCGPCIDALPKLDSLQQVFKQQIMVIPITYERSDMVAAFIQNSKVLKSFHLPSVTENTEMKKFFPHKFIPHEIWIDANGIVQAITASDEVNEANIRKYLKGEQLQVKTKKDILGVSFNKPLLFDAIKGKPGPINKDKLINSSLFLGYIEGLGGVAGAPIVNDSLAMIKCMNVSIESLYQSAFGTTNKPAKGGFDPQFDYSLRRASRLIWEAKDSSYYFWPGRSRKSLTDIPHEKMFFTYELVLPRKDSLKLNAYMVQDLNRYFGDRLGIEGIKEKRKVKCWVLKREGDADLIASKGGKPDFTMNSDTEKLIFKNMSIHDFLFWWEMEALDRYPIPIVNETDYMDNIDISLDANPKDFESVRKAIRKCGLDFVSAEREIDMIVIRDKK